MPQPQQKSGFVIVRAFQGVRVSPSYTTGGRSQEKKKRKIDILYDALCHLYTFQYMQVTYHDALGYILIDSIACKVYTNDALRHR